jgi:hypothetical protein
LAAAIALFTALIAYPACAGNIFDDPSIPAKPTPPGPATAPTTTPALPPPATAPSPPPTVIPPAPPVVPPATAPVAEKPRLPQIPTPAPKPPEIVRRAIPPKADLDRSRTLLKEAFAQQLADRTIPARHKLAETLLSEAAKAGENPSDQFALFGGAINAAKESASLRMVEAVADEMARTYAVDSPQVKVTAALSMPLKADTPLNTAENVLAGLEMLDTLIAADDIAVAHRLCVLLRPAAIGDPGLVAVVVKRQQELELIRTAHDRVAPAIEKLKSSPDDAAANSAVGSYQCFYIGNWPRGLSMLAKGLDAELKKLAIDDLAAPTGAEALMKLGDGWWNAAAKQPITAQSKIRQHAAALYADCTGNLSPLQKLKIDKRIAEVGGGTGGTANTAATGLRDVIVQHKLARLREFTDRFAGKPGAARTPFPADEPLEGDVVWTATEGGYSLTGDASVGHNAGNHGRKLKDRSAKVKAEPGFHIEGGNILVSKGSLDLHGDPANPIILKNVHVGCELTGSIKASYVIFDNCTFTKEGGFGWIGYPSAKFEFTDCLLLQSNFKRFSWDDFGIKLNRCTFAGCKFPERDSKPKKTEDTYKTARHEWSRIADCEFYDCELSASVFWMPERCNFFGCKAADEATYASPSNLTVELGLLADERDRLLNDLRGNVTSSGEGHAIFTAAPGLYPALAFPKP